MHRRTFLALLMSSTAAAAFGLPRLASAQTTTPRALNITITSKFMQDYGEGEKITFSDARDYVFTARDGTVNIYSIAGVKSQQHWVMRTYQSPGSLTGWTTERLELPDAMRTGTILAGFFPSIAVLQLRTTDVLSVYFSDIGVQSVLLQPDGSIKGSLAAFAPYPAGLPLTTGALPKGLYWIAEMRSQNPGFLEGPWTVQIRGAFSDLAFPAPGLTVTGTPYTRRGWFPLRDPTKQTCRLVVHQEDGDVVYYRLALVPQSATAGTHYDVVERRVLTHCDSGCVTVREDTPGQVEVFKLEESARMVGGWWGGGPNEPAKKWYGALKSLKFSYVAGQPVAWSTLVETGSSLRDAPPYEDGTVFGLANATNPVTGATQLFFTALRPVEGYGWDTFQNPSASSVAATAPYTDTWLITRRPGKPFQPPLLVDRGGRVVGYFEEGDLAAAVTFTEADGFSVWRQLESGEFEQEIVHPEAKDAHKRPAASYRVGIRFDDNGAPAAGVSVSLRASNTCYAAVNGGRVRLAPRRATQALTDATGMVWVTVLTGNRLLLPNLTLTSPRLANAITIDLHQAVQTFLSTVTGDAIRDAVDPRDGSKVLPEAKDAEAVAKALRDLMARSNYTPPKTAMAVQPAGLRSDLPTRFSAPDSPVAESAGPPSNAGGAWKLTGGPDGLKFEALDSGQAALEVARLFRQPAAALIKWPWEYVEDAYHYIVDKVEEIAEIVVDGVKAALQVVIDGIKYAYTFVMDTLEKVFEAVDWVLHKAGVLLGRLSGWLLSHLGFLFPWEKIKARRDQYRDMIYDLARSAKTRYANPDKAFVTIANGIDSTRTAVTNALTSFKTERPAKTNFGSWISAAPSPISQLSKAGNSFLSEATWMLEKVYSVLPGNRFSPGVPDIPGLESAFDDLIRALLDMVESLAPTAQDFTELLASWVDSITTFSSAAFNALLDVLIRHITALFDGLKSVAQAMGKAMSALWSNMDKLVDWFDQEISTGFLGGFYEGLTDHKFSAFDLICLLAGTIGELGGRASRPKIAMTVEDDKQRLAAGIFSSFGALTTAISGGYTAATDAKSGGKLGLGLTLIDQAINMTSTLLRSQQNDEEWEFYLMCGLVGVVAVGGAGFQAGKSLDYWKGPSDKVIDNYITTAILVLYFVNSQRAIISFAKNKNYNDGVIEVISTVQAFAAFAMRLARPLKPLPYAPLLYGGLQGVCSAVKTWLVFDRPI